MSKKLIKVDFTHAEIIIYRHRRYVMSRRSRVDISSVIQVESIRIRAVVQQRQLRYHRLFLAWFLALFYVVFFPFFFFFAST